MTAPAFLARDDFGRTVANGWGTAEVGGAWTVGGPADRWSVSGGRGNVSLNAGNGYTASLNALSAASSDVSFNVGADKVATGGGQYISVIGRRVAATTDYRAKVQLAANGTVSLWLARTVSGTETLIAGGGVVVGPDGRGRRPVRGADAGGRELPDHPARQDLEVRRRPSRPPGPARVATAPPASRSPVGSGCTTTCRVRRPTAPSSSAPTGSASPPRDTGATAGG